MDSVDPNGHGQAGETLVEVLVSVALSGLLVAALIGGLFTSIKASQVQRQSAISEVVVRNFSEALTDAPYVACGTTADYTNPATFNDVTGYAMTIDSVTGWDEDSAPATFSAFAGDCASTGADTGLQKIEYSVSVATDNGTQERHHSVLKRYNGTFADLDQPLPAGGVRCTVSAYQDTYLDENDQGANFGSEVSMDLAGTASARRESLLRFDLRPDVATCIDGSTVPSGMAVRSVSLRLYTWQIAGAPDCATQCKHQLNRVASSWSQDITTWASKPSKIATPTAKFTHGTGTGDYTARYQMITGAGLNNDVSIFYAANSANFGWSIQQDCGTAGTDCTAPSPGFQMRTSEWSEVAQRPTLSIVFVPDNGPGKQLRNVGYGTCASVKDGDYSNGNPLVSLGCAGRRDQLWTHPGPESGNRESEFGAVTSSSCMETAGASSSGSPAKLWGCNNAAHQKWDIVGLAIKYRPDPTKCLAVSAAKLGSAIVIQTCNGSPEQQWVYGPPPTFVPNPDVRLTSLDSAGVPNGDCADVDVRKGQTPITENIRWAQTFPCLGPSQLSQHWNLGPDGRILDRLNPGYCLTYDPALGVNLVGVWSCDQGSGQLWDYDGTQLRNIKLDKCLTSLGGRQWLTLQPCTNGAGQKWSLDPAATAPSLATVVQLRNNKYGDCIEPNGDLTDGRQVWTWECGALDRPNQAFIQLSTNELAFRAQPGLCLTSWNQDAPFYAEECKEINWQNQVPANTWQQYPVNGSSQLQYSGTNNCAQGNGNLQFVTKKSCLTSGDQSSQQWSLEELGTATSALRQMRNVATGSCADLPGGVDAISWPCTGTVRGKQGMLLAKIGDEYEIRLESNPTQCLDVQSNGNDNATVRPINCNFGSYQRWTLSAQGQLKTKSPKGRCLQGGLDNDQLRMKDCTTSDNQRWVFEAPQDTRQLRQIRNIESQTCLDVVGPVGENVKFTGYPCVNLERPNQVFVQLNNGALASAASSDNYCVDAGNSNGAAVLLWGCKNPVDSHNWDSANSKLRQVKFNRCAEFDPIWATTSAQPCGTNAAKPYQAWAVEAVGTTVASNPIQFRSANPAPDQVNGCLDVDGATRTDFWDNNKVMVLPCLGTARTNQSFRMMSNGVIRSTGTPTQCLDAASTAQVKRPVLYTCNSNSDDQRWKMDVGRIMNVTKAGVSRGKCIQGGLDGMQATMENCSNVAEQQWVSEDLGATVRADAVGHLRTAQADLCLETNTVQGVSSVPIWGWPCLFSGRSQQRFVRLNTGQYRPVDNLGFCVDDNGGAAEANPKTNPCIAPTVPPGAGAGQRWVLNPTKFWLNSLSSALCVEAPGGGLVARQRACAADGGGNPTNPNQQWLFVPGPGL